MIIGMLADCDGPAVSPGRSWNRRDSSAHGRPTQVDGSKRRLGHFPLRRLACRNQGHRRNACEFVELPRADIERLQNRLRQALGVARVADVQQRSALDDRLVEETLGGRHGHQGRDFCAPAGLAENRDVAWIAAEGCDVVAHPLERRHQVQLAGVA